MAECPSPIVRSQTRLGPVAGQLLAMAGLSTMKLRRGPPHCNQLVSGAGGAAATPRTIVNSAFTQGNMLLSSKLPRIISHQKAQ